MATKHMGLGLSWYGVILVAAVGALAWSDAVALATLGSALLAATTYSVFSARRVREHMPGNKHHIYLGLIVAAVACALLGTFAASSDMITDDEGRDHSLSYGIVCAVSLIFGYRAVIKRTPRALAVFTTFTHVFGFIVVVYNFLGRSHPDAEWGAPLVVRTSPAAFAMFGLLGTTALACAIALLHSIPSREDDELSDVPEAHVID